MTYASLVEMYLDAGIDLAQAMLAECISDGETWQALGAVHSLVGADMLRSTRGRTADEAREAGRVVCALVGAAEGEGLNAVPSVALVHWMPPVSGLPSLSRGG